MDSIKRRKLRNFLTAAGLALLIFAAKVLVKTFPPSGEGLRFDVPLEGWR
jgi:hypothetical protein